MPRKLLASIVVLSLLVPLASANHAHVKWEVHESNPEAHQRTCIAETWAGTGAGACAPVPTGYTHPLEGAHVLDAFARSGASSLNHEPPRYPTFSTGSPIHRETDGTVPDVLLPGRAWFYAWFGFWSDANGNGIVDQAVRGANTSTAPTGQIPLEYPLGSWVGYNPGNEFVAWDSTARHGHASMGDLYGFVEPGSHPPGTETQKPHATQPDFKYIDPGQDMERLHHTHTGVVILDGSLLEPYRVETVSDIVLAPDVVNNRPYRTTETSRVDVDRYVAVAPGPVTALYQATAAPVVNEWSTPVCPNNCVVPPFPVQGAGPALDLLFPGYERETAEGDGNTASGRLAEFQADWGAWLDILPVAGFPKTVYNPAKRGFPLAGGPNDALAVPPGTLVAIEAWSGAWRDHDEDGVIGAGGSDPYEGGNRPVPHRYYESRGEFVPWNTGPVAGGAGSMRVTLTPHASWGPAGVFLFGDSGLPSQDPTRCETLPHGGRRCDYLTENTWFQGSTPITLVMTSFGAEEGHQMSTDYLLFPAGTTAGGFTVCSDWRVLKMEKDGIALDETVRDCDEVAAFDA